MVTSTEIVRDMIFMWSDAETMHQLTLFGLLRMKHLPKGEFTVGYTAISDEFHEGRPSTSAVDAEREMIRNNESNAHNFASFERTQTLITLMDPTRAQKQGRVESCKEMPNKFNRGHSNLVYNIVTDWQNLDLIARALK